MAARPSRLLQRVSNREVILLPSKTITNRPNSVTGGAFDNGRWGKSLLATKTCGHENHTDIDLLQC